MATKSLSILLLLTITTTHSLSPAPHPSLPPPPSPATHPPPPSPATHPPPSSPAPHPPPKSPATHSPPPSSSELLPPSSAPSPAVAGNDCSTPLLNLSSCLTYVEQGANLTVPEKGCCPSLAGLVDSNPICLCQLLSTSDAFGIKIDDTRALTLPTICHVQTPPVSLCNDLGIPVPSPQDLSPSGAATAGGQPSGSGPLAPASQTAGATNRRSTAGVASLLTLLVTAGQAAAMIFF